MGKQDNIETDVLIKVKLYIKPNSQTRADRKSYSGYIWLIITEAVFLAILCLYYLEWEKDDRKSLHCD